MPKLVMRAARDRWAVDALFVGKDVFWTGLPSGSLTLQRLFDAVPVQREPSGTPGFTSLWIVDDDGRGAPRSEAASVLGLRHARCPTP